MLFRKITTLLILFIFHILNVNSQQYSFLSGLVIKPYCHYGFIINHHREMAYFTDRHIAPFEINILKKTNGKKSWHKLYNYPDIGIGLFTSSFSSSEILGTVIASYPFMNFIFQAKPLNFTTKIGTGLGYFTNKFHRYENIKNLAISTTINAVISLREEASFKISSVADINFGIGITHFSNGAFKTPNLGLNIFTVSSAIALYPWGKTNILKDTNTDIKENNQKAITISHWFAGAIKETYPVYGKKFKALSLSNDVIIATKSKKNYIGLGIDFFYDESDIKYLKDYEIQFNNNIEAIRIGISAINEFKFNKLAFNQYLGFYIYSKNKSNGPFYQRLSLRYNIYKKMFACVSLKTHWGKADFTEWGIGYRY